MKLAQLNDNTTANHDIIIKLGVHMYHLYVMNLVNIGVDFTINDVIIFCMYFAATSLIFELKCQSKAKHLGMLVGIWIAYTISGVTYGKQVHQNLEISLILDFLKIFQLGSFWYQV